jgi:anaerobic dimethyl sulfoxide reductase subunit C (anchor subunit)/Tat-targeted selenate reductase subunit YnfH
MEHAFAEMPLAVFSTLEPLGAGAFILLALAFITGVNNPEQLKKIDQLTIVPIVLIVVGFVAALLHIHDFGHITNALNGIGRSPLSNEVAAGIVFTVVAVLYWILALTGKLPGGARKALSALTAVLGVVFVGLIGAAYLVKTIPSWDTIWAPVGVLGQCLLGGGVFALLVLQIGGSLKDEKVTTFRLIAIAVTIVGGVMAIGGLAGQFILASGLAETLPAVGLDFGQIQLWLIGFIIGAIILVVVAGYSLFKQANTGLLGASCIIAVATVFAGRMVFYALMINVGL